MRDGISQWHILRGAIRIPAFPSKAIDVRAISRPRQPLAVLGREVARLHELFVRRCTQPCTRSDLILEEIDRGCVD